MVSDAYPPHSRDAIYAAASNQYDRIRFSVRVTSDGKYVLVHDDTINSIARMPDGKEIDHGVYVSDCTLDVLNSYDYGIKYDTEYSGMNIPLLEEGLFYANICNLGVTLEFKGFIPDENQVEELFLLLCKYNAVKNLMIISGDGYNKEMYMKFKEKSPFISYFIGATYEELQRMIADIDDLRTDKNDLYWCPYPWGILPSDEMIIFGSSHGLLIFFSDIFSTEDLFEAAIGKGVYRLECQDIPMIKDAFLNRFDEFYYYYE